MKNLINNFKNLSSNMKAIIGIIGMVLLALVVIGIQKVNGPVNPLKDVETIKVSQNSDLWSGQTKDEYEFSDSSTDKINKNIMMAVAKKKYHKAKKVIPNLKSSSKDGFFQGISDSMNDYDKLKDALGTEDANKFLDDVSSISSKLKFKKVGRDKVKAYYDLSEEQAKEYGIDPSGKVFDV